jgi:CRP/FNR family transcriptional regulator, cyclic AMP receptor protein
MTTQAFFIKNGSKLKFRKGDVLIRSDEEPRGIYFLYSGVVKMSTISKDGTEIVFNLFKPGSFFPMIWAITETKNLYEFQAITSTIIYRVSRKDTLEFLEKENTAYIDLIKRILTGFDNLLRGLQFLLFGNSTKRVAAALLILGRRFGQKTGKDVTLKIKIRHEDIAGMAALSRETVSLAIGELEEKKIIQQKRRLFIINKPDELKAIAGMEDFFSISSEKGGII